MNFTLKSCGIVNCTTLLEVAGYRNSSNLVRPLINADKLFWQSGTNLFPLKISADAFSPISDFPLI